MKVIKAVYERGGKRISTFAEGEWQKEYAKGVETKPDIGYLFAFSSKDLQGAKSEFSGGVELWLAEAKVVGRVIRLGINVEKDRWKRFWKLFKLSQRQKQKAEYLLCSSITLIRKLA